LCRRFKGDPLFADVPIIFISAFDDAESKVKGFEAGAVDCIPKPFHHDEVIARVQSQLALKHLRQQEQELAVLRERQRIARDLHNAVSQTLLSAGSMIDKLIAHGGHDLFTEQTLLRLADLSRRAAAEIRTILYEPRPEALAGVDLADPLAGAYAGTLVMPPPEAKAASQRGDPLEHDTLTERERRILSLMVQGLNNNEIAQRVLFSRATVKASVSMILEKLGARTRVEAVAIALKRGLVDDQRG
jgi:DNA-binding NarL/FixJ family response regulator